VGVPAAIGTWGFSLQAVEQAGRLLLQGVDPLDATESGIVLVELDESVHSVGYGGRPNAEGTVEVDAAIMDGRDLGVGSVAGVQECRTPIVLARHVLARAPHPMLVGSGAELFAASAGLPREEALSPEARTEWERWRNEAPGYTFGHDTIGLLVADPAGNLVAGCSTSGKAYKHPGRVGDSPLVGCGLYADNEAGAASATGNGDEILKHCMSFQIVELMRAGSSPTEACDEVIERYMRRHPDRLNERISLIALSPSGETGAATLGCDFPYAVWKPDGCEVTVLPRRTPES
jgi:N4-(beta-N-acetylglucosaminyl)-L-asparaginase